MAGVLRLATLAALGVIFLHVAAADIIYGSSRADVIAELGKPTSMVKRGVREVLLYPKNVRFELKNGQVVDIKGYVPTGVVRSPATPAPAAREEEKEIIPAEKPAVKGATPGPAEYSPAEAANKLGDEVAKMDTAWGSSPTRPVHKETFSLAKLAVGMVLHFILTIVGLRLAFKYWEMDAFWSGTFAIAGIDAAIKTTLEALSPVTQGFTTLGHVDAAIAWFVMIGTVRHFCFNKRLQDALLTAAFVKVAVTTIYIFVSIALFGALFH